jgi:hypothetical protein
MSQQKRRDFSPPTVYANGWGVRSALTGFSLEVDAWSALEELAWRTRLSKSAIVEELVVSYLNAVFPERELKTRHAAKYDVAIDAEEEEDAERINLHLKPGARWFDHRERQWRRGSRSKLFVPPEELAEVKGNGVGP